LMTAAGLRVTEASYLRAQDIDLEAGLVQLNQEGNENRTKGGRPRQASFRPDFQEFMAELKASGQASPSQHIFQDRRSLPDRARELVRNACQALNIPCLGTHGFRKTYAVATYHDFRAGGASDHQSLLETSHQLGHNRTAVTSQSYVSSQERAKEDL
jgi:integrase